MTDTEIGRAVYERFSRESNERAQSGTFIDPGRAVERLGELIFEVAPDVTRERLPAIIIAFKAETMLRRKPKSQRLPS